MISSRLILVEDERLLGKTIQRFLSQNYECHWFETAEEAIADLQRTSADLLISDIALPGKSGLDLLDWVLEKKQSLPVILITAHSSIQNAVNAIKKGAYDYLSKPLDLESLELAIQRALKTQRLHQELSYHRLKTQRKQQHGFLNLPSEAFQNVANIIQRLVTVEEKTGEIPSILITGETGTGKGVLARYFHNLSPRRAESFIEVNCTAIPDTLVESELFGHEKGTFTGATNQRVGMFELAKGGTLFLDEIGHISLSVQAKLLKVIEDKKVRKVGGHRENQINVRVIAATNLDLKQAVKDGKFREDLYHRLSLIHLKLPALKEIPDSIAALSEFYLEQAHTKYQTQRLSLTEEHLRLLKRHSWPGNIRELRNEIERSVLLYDGKSLNFEHLRHLQKNEDKESAPSLFELPVEGLDLPNVEPQLIARALMQSSQDIGAASGLLKMTLEELRHRMAKFNLPSETQKAWFSPIPDEGVQIVEVEKALIQQALDRVGHKVAAAARLLNVSRDVLRYRLEKHQITAN